MKISVLLCTYNHGAYLEKCITSVLDQAYKDIEFIIVNDGSTDDSKSVIQSFKDQRIKEVHLLKNEGFEAAMKKALYHATGDLQFGIGADDYLCSDDFFELAIESFKRWPEIGLVWAAVRLFNQNGEYKITLGSANGVRLIQDESQVATPYFFNSTTFLIDFLLFKSFVPGHSAIFKRSCFNDVGGYHFDLGPQNDYFPNHAVPSKFGAAFIPKAVSHARIFDDNSNMNSKSSDEERIQRHASFEKRMRDLGILKNDGLWLAWRERLISQIAPNKINEAKVFFEKAVC